MPEEKLNLLKRFYAEKGIVLFLHVMLSRPPCHAERSEASGQRMGCEERVMNKKSPPRSFAHAQDDREKKDVTTVVYACFPSISDFPGKSV
jgi:hypothetical protein